MKRVDLEQVIVGLPIYDLVIKLVSKSVRLGLRNEFCRSLQILTDKVLIPLA
jgi:hypothetical protein